MFAAATGCGTPKFLLIQWLSKFLMILLAHHPVAVAFSDGNVVPSPSYGHCYEVEASDLRVQGETQDCKVGGEVHCCGEPGRYGGRAIPYGRSIRPCAGTPQGERPGAARLVDPHPQYTKAINFLLSQTDYEKMRVVRYNTTTFSLDRMRLLLKHLGNPQLRSLRRRTSRGQRGRVRRVTCLRRCCRRGD